MKRLSEVAGSTIGMAVSSDLQRHIRNVIVEGDVTHVLETGTYRGLGSTRMLAEAFADRSPPSRFVTIEANWVSWRQARRNLAPFPFVEPLWGRTIPAARAMAFIEADEALRNHERYPGIYIDETEDPVAFYKREVRGRFGGGARNPRYVARWLFDRVFAYAGDDLLGRHLKRFRETNPLVLLDSAGGIGYLEFRTTREILDGRPYVLLLDDIHHVKHFRSCSDIQNDPAFDILAINAEDGWLLARHRA